MRTVSTPSVSQNGSVNNVTLQFRQWISKHWESLPLSECREASFLNNALNPGNNALNPGDGILRAVHFIDRSEEQIFLKYPRMSRPSTTIDISLWRSRLQTMQVRLCNLDPVRMLADFSPEDEPHNRPDLPPPI